MTPSRHIFILGYAVFMGVCALIFKYIGVSMGWLYMFMGTLLGSAVVPIALCISVKKANRMGCVVGALAGFASGITGELGVDLVFQAAKATCRLACRYLKAE